MIKFVIVDDEKEYRDRYINIINKIMFKNDEKYEIVQFDGYSEKLKNFICTDTFFKIYILDIQLKGHESGLDIAKEIRETDWDSEIIFITSHDRMFDDVFQTLYKVFYFIKKFHKLDETLTEKLTLIINKGFDKKKFFYFTKSSDLQIYLKDIYYIYRETAERKIIIVTKNNNFSTSLSITEALSKLDDRFKQVHRACIVNTDYVQEYNWSEGSFTLSSGEKVNLCSKNYRTQKGNIKNNEWNI